MHRTLAVVTAALLCLSVHARAQDPSPPPQQTQEAEPAAPTWKLLFSGSQDITDTWGSLHFGVTPVRLIRECEPPGFTVVGCFPLPDGAWEVFGQQMTEISRGDEPYDRVAAWKLLRATTRDGVTFENLETVFEPQPASWTDHSAMAYNPDAKEYLLLKLKMDRSGFAYTAFFSADGKQWQEHPGNPLFYDGDSMSLFWSPVLHRFVCVSKSLQPLSQTHPRSRRPHARAGRRFPARPAGADDAIQSRRPPLGAVRLAVRRLGPPRPQRAPFRRSS